MDYSIGGTVNSNPLTTPQTGTDTTPTLITEELPINDLFTALGTIVDAKRDVGGEVHRLDADLGDQLWRKLDAAQTLIDGFIDKAHERFAD